MMYTWQKDLLAGFKPGELAIISVARGTGKSMINSFYHKAMQTPAIRILSQSEVDGETWYTVQCKPSTVAGWIKEQDSSMWYRHTDLQWAKYFNVFDMHEKLYTMLQLKFA